MATQSAFVHGQHPITARLVAALGLEPQQVKAVTIYIDVNEIVTANVTYHPSQEQVEAAAKVLEEAKADGYTVRVEENPGFTADEIAKNKEFANDFAKMMREDGYELCEDKRWRKAAGVMRASEFIVDKDDDPDTPAIVEPP